MSPGEQALARIEGARAAVSWAIAAEDWGVWVQALAVLAEHRLAAGYPDPTGLYEDDDEEDDEDLAAHDRRASL